MKIVIYQDFIEFYSPNTIHLQIGIRNATWEPIYGDLEYSDYSTFSYPYARMERLDLR